MANDKVKITFKPSGQIVKVLPETTILDAALKAGIEIDVPCGGKGICGKCRVEVIEGASEPNANEKAVISTEQLAKGVRLACQTKIYHEMKVKISQRNTSFEENILTDGVESVIEWELNNGKMGKYGIAFDIGTTTLVGMLVNLHDGKQLGVEGCSNPQAKFGDDVISRINYCISHNKGLHELHASIINKINTIIKNLCKNSGIKKSEIYEITVAGNTTMNHIFLGIDPSSLGYSPYKPCFVEPKNTKASDLKIDINENGNVYTLPNIAGYVGGDTVAGILSSGMYNTDKITLIVDIGTNGEIALGNKERIITCSAAAGPAFEGARISQGMRADYGAIDKVVINDDVRVNVIGNVEPRGICGTGLIDAVAELLREGIIDNSGKINDIEHLTGNISDKIKNRIVKGENGTSFILVEKENVDSKPIMLTQKDVRELQLAKGAIYAGIMILCREYGIEPSEIEEILLAGAFGNYINPKSAVRVGILPNVSIERIKFIGNAAGSGAKLTLLSPKHRTIAEQIARTAQYIELAANPDFQTIFMDAMGF